MNGYELHPAPPERASLKAHAETLKRTLFEVSPRSLEKWPVELTTINGKRQPTTAEIFAAAIALYHNESDRNVAILRLPDGFAQEVEALLPAALDAWREIREARKAVAA